MKKTLLFLTCVFAFSLLQAQWVNDPINNTKLVTLSSGIIPNIQLCTNEATGDTYVMAYGSNQINLQRINVNGVPQWGEQGIYIECQEPKQIHGTGITTTIDDAVVIAYTDGSNKCYAMKFDKDGNALWGEQGSHFFGCLDDSVSLMDIQIQSDSFGGIWIMAQDFDNIYLLYSNPYGTPNPAITISNSDCKCQNGQLILGPSGVAYVTYERIVGDANEVEKEIWVEGYVIDGETASLPVKLMNVKLINRYLNHNAISDGMGGGYAFISCPDTIGNNTFVFHFDANGCSTISEPYGIPVHTSDMYVSYDAARATIDPVTHDIIIVCKLEKSLESKAGLFLNRITTTGEVIWDDGIYIYDGYELISQKTIDIYPDGSGFMVSIDCHPNNDTQITIDACGFDMDGNQTWHTLMNSVVDDKRISQNTTGFHNGQNIIAWTNKSDGNIYGQNIDMNGIMGPIASVNENGSTMSAEIFQNGTSLIISAETLSQVEIISMTGQSIKTVETNGNTAEINVSGFTPGLYIVRMNDANGNILVKKAVIR